MTESYAFVEEAKRRNVDCYVYQNTIDITKLEELQKLVNKVFYEQPDMDGMFLSNDILAAQALLLHCRRGFVYRMISVLSVMMIFTSVL